MKLFVILAVLLGSTVVACDGQAPASTAKKTGVAKSAAAARPAPAASRYEVHGVIDPGISNMVAFALKIPRGWRMKQSFQRAWSGATPINVIYILLTSPDQRSAIEYFPEQHYHYMDGPQTRSMEQMARQYGGVPSDPGKLAPMPPIAYIKNLALPELAKTAAGRIRVTGEQAGAVQNLGQGSQRVTGYVDGVLPSGRKVRIETAVQTFTQNLNGEVYCNWSATTNVTQSDTDLAAAYAYNLAAQKSVVLNPAWQQQNQQLVSNGQRSNQIEAQKRAAIQKDFQDYRNKLYNETAANRRASQDRQNEAFGDLMRGEAKYEDAATGERIKVTDGYSHVYSDRQGNTLSTNVPLDAGQVNWQELQRVEVKNY